MLAELPALALACEVLREAHAAILAGSAIMKHSFAIDLAIPEVWVPFESLFFHFFIYTPPFWREALSCNASSLLSLHVEGWSLFY